MYCAFGVAMEFRSLFHAEFCLCFYALHRLQRPHFCYCMYGDNSVSCFSTWTSLFCDLCKRMFFFCVSALQFLLEIADYLYTYPFNNDFGVEHTKPTFLLLFLWFLLLKFHCNSIFKFLPVVDLWLCEWANNFQSEYFFLPHVCRLYPGIIVSRQSFQCLVFVFVFRTKYLRWNHDIHVFCRSAILISETSDRASIKFGIESLHWKL